MPVKRSDIEKTKEAQTDFKNKIKNRIKTVFNNINAYFKKIKYSTIKIHILPFVSLLITIVALTISMNIVMASRHNGEQKEKAQFGIMHRLSSLKQSNTYYCEIATKEELLFRWIELFSDSTYMRDGDPKKDQYDCVSSVYTFLKSFNSNVQLDDVKSVVRRAENLAARSELEIKKTLQAVKPGDIIVIRNPGTEPNHLGIVYDTKNGYVLYMHVNAMVNGMSFDKHRFTDYQIYAIYSVSYSFWIGDMMSKINQMK